MCGSIFLKNRHPATVSAWRGRKVVDIRWRYTQHKTYDTQHTCTQHASCMQNAIPWHATRSILIICSIHIRIGIATYNTTDMQHTSMQHVTVEPWPQAETMTTHSGVCGSRCHRACRSSCRSCHSGYRVIHAAAQSLYPGAQCLYPRCPGACTPVLRCLYPWCPGACTPVPRCLYPRCPIPVPLLPSSLYPCAQCLYPAA